MRFHVLTLFPEFFVSALSSTMLQKGQERGVLSVDLVNIRDYATDKHRMTDDTPYGGGSGMVMKPEPLVGALEAVSAASPGVHKILLSPRGARFAQAHAVRLAQKPALALVCGRYEGVDERVLGYVDEEISLGDFILSGGEIAALAVLDAVARLVPGFLGCAASAHEESFSDGLLEYPQYTRPLDFRGQLVPEILRSGDHGAVARWRRREALRRTLHSRPDLLETAPLSDDDRRWLAELRESQP